MTRIHVLAFLAILSIAIPAGSASHATAETPVKYYMPTQSGAAAGPAASSNDLVYHNGPIQHAPKVYLVFWGWGGSDPSGEAPYLQRFFNGTGGSSWAGVTTQYGNSTTTITNPTGELAGVWWDDTGTWPVIPDVDIANEASSAEHHFGFSADANYIIATPHLHNDAQFGEKYCAYHSYFNDGSGNIFAYTDLPYQTDATLGSCGENSVNSGSAGVLDGVSIVAGHEFAETITDPLQTAWYDSAGQEIGDKCAWVGLRDVTFTSGTFAIQPLWSNSVSGCATS